MWTKISKIVDGWHIRNHKDARCKVIYNPHRFYERHAQLEGERDRNTMPAERLPGWEIQETDQCNHSR